MKTARLQVLTTPAFRDRLRKEAKKAGVSVAELVRTLCEGTSAEEEQSGWRARSIHSKNSVHHVVFTTIIETELDPAHEKRPNILIAT
jgi:hypothetical protein